MWIFYAIGSSFFAGITAILAKCGIKKTDSDVATAIRTVVVLLFSWFMVLITGTWSGITQIDGQTLLFLVLSGLATGASWLCYFHALQKGDINKVVPIDKSSTVLSILLALIFLHEGITGSKIVSIVLIGNGTMMMITKKDIETDSGKKSGGWLICAVLSAIFASLTSILGKIGIEGIDSNLGSAAYGVDYGVCYRKTESDKGDREERIRFYLSVRIGNGSIMALLLSGITRGTGKRGNPD